MTIETRHEKRNAFRAICQGMEISMFRVTSRSRFDGRNLENLNWVVGNNVTHDREIVVE